MNRIILALLITFSLHFFGASQAFFSPRSTSEKFIIGSTMLPSLTIYGVRNMSTALEGEIPFKNDSIHLSLASRQIMQAFPNSVTPSSNQLSIHYKRPWLQGKFLASPFIGTTLTLADVTAASVDCGLVLGFDNPGLPLVYAPITASFYSDGYILTIQTGLNFRLGGFLFDVALRDELLRTFDQTRSGSNLYYVLGVGHTL